MEKEDKIRIDSFLNRHYFGENGDLITAYNEGWRDCSKWKGEQLKAWLEEKKKQKPLQYNYCTKKCQNTEYHNVIDELINDLFGGGQKEDKAGEDLCKTCSHLWPDSPLPLDHYITHCDVADLEKLRKRFE